ncbi:hypothetical protein FPV67DRAFT_1704293 [Lyophyllum atratum]|nr:hypothetical protein FPV67DRAFT_1704293 [Lyophyllum atratum]
MAHVVSPLDQPSNYKDSQTRVDRQRQNDMLSKSTTLYIGNLSFYTTEEQIYELFTKCASPEDGGWHKTTPCGFCFVEYYTHSEALASMRYVSGTKLDERIIRYEHRQDYDAGRGGWGAQAQRLEVERRREVEERYADAQEGPGADWKEAEGPAPDTKKRGRSPEDEGDNTRTVQRTRLEEEVEAERM